MEDDAFEEEVEDAVDFGGVGAGEPCGDFVGLCSEGAHDLCEEDLSFGGLDFFGGLVFFEVFDAGVEIGGAFFVAFYGEGTAQVGVFEAGALGFEFGELCLVFVLFGG